MDELAQLLTADADGAFAFARQVLSGGTPSKVFLDELKATLPRFTSAHCHREGTAEWARLVAALMIAREYSPNESAGVAAPFLTSEDSSVSTASYRLLLEVTRIDRLTFAAVIRCAADCGQDCTKLLKRLKHCIVD